MNEVKGAPTAQPSVQCLLEELKRQVRYAGQVEDAALLAAETLLGGNRAHPGAEKAAREPVSVVERIEFLTEALATRLSQTHDHLIALHCWLEVGTTPEPDGQWTPEEQASITARAGTTGPLTLNRLSDQVNAASEIPDPSGIRGRGGYEVDDRTGQLITRPHPDLRHPSNFQGER